MKGIFERTWTAALFGFIAALSVSLNTVNGSNWRAAVYGAIGAGIGGGISVLKNSVFVPSTTIVWLNVLERAAWSFVEGAAAVVPAVLVPSAAGLIAAGWVAIGGGIQAVLSLAKNLSAAASTKALSIKLNAELGGVGAGGT